MSQANNNNKKSTNNHTQHKIQKCSYVVYVYIFGKIYLKLMSIIFLHVCSKRCVWNENTGLAPTPTYHCARSKKAANKQEWEWELRKTFVKNQKSDAGHMCIRKCLPCHYVCVCACACIVSDVWSLCTCCRTDKKMHDILIRWPMLIPLVWISSFLFLLF